jgi:hypothetical protein
MVKVPGFAEGWMKVRTNKVMYGMKGEVGRG